LKIGEDLAKLLLNVWWLSFWTVFRKISQNYI